MSLLHKVLKNLRRPLPDLVGFLIDKIRSRLWRRYLLSTGARFHVSRGALIQGCQRIQIGDGFYAGQMLWIEAVEQYREFRYTPIIKIGRNVNCSQSVHISATSGVMIGDGVLIGSKVHITDHAHGSYNGGNQSPPSLPPSYRQLSSGQPVTIEENVWIGDGVVVLSGVTIGAGSIVGANSVVSRSLPPGVMAVGAPARIIKRFDADSSRWLPISS